MPAAAGTAPPGSGLSARAAQSGGAQERSATDGTGWRHPPAGCRVWFNNYRWDADQALDDLKEYVVEHPVDGTGDPVVDETGFLKKGDKSVGVQRHCGADRELAGWRVPDPRRTQGQGIAGSELYFPQVWNHDHGRRRGTGERRLSDQTITGASDAEEGTGSGCSLHRR